MFLGRSKTWQVVDHPSGIGDEIVWMTFETLNRYSGWWFGTWPWKIPYKWKFIAGKNIYSYIIIWLVVWNMNFIFPYIGNDNAKRRTHIFQRGRYTTNQIHFGQKYSRFIEGVFMKTL